MIKQKYEGFADREDVARQFDYGEGPCWDSQVPFTPKADFPKDKDIICAFYDNAGYEGSAFVLFKRGRKLFEVHGSHCSCFGLEDQWEPEETTWGALAIRQSSVYGAPEAVVKMAQRRVKRGAK